MSYCFAGSRVDNLRSEFEKHVKKTSARQDKLEADVREINQKLDQVLALLGPQAVPKRDLRKPSAAGEP